MIGTEFTRANQPLIVRNNPEDSEFWRKWWAFKESCIDCLDFFGNTDLTFDFRGSRIPEPCKIIETKVLVEEHENVGHFGRIGSVSNHYLAGFKQN